MRYSIKPPLKKYFFKGFILSVILLISMPFIITPALNTHYIKNKIAEFIFEKTNIHFDPSKLSVSIFPQTNLIINRLILNPGNKIIVDIASVKLNIATRKLLQGDIIIEKISIIRPQIKTRIPSLVNSSKQNKSLGLMNFSFPVLIKEVTKIFALLPDHQDFVEVSFNEIRSPYFKRVDGTLYFYKKKKEIKLTVEIEGIVLKPSSFSTSFEKYLDLNSLRFEKIKLNTTLDSKGKIYGQCDIISPKFLSRNNHILLDANTIGLTFQLSEKFYQVDTKPSKLNYPSGIIAVHFLNDELKKTSKLKIIGNQIQIDQTRRMSSILLKDNEVSNTLFNILEAGIAPDISIIFEDKTLKNLLADQNLDIKGTIRKGRVKIPETPLVVSNIKGNVQVNKGVLKINTDSAMIQATKIEKGTLSVDLLNYIDYPFQGNFSLDVDLSKISETLISLLPGTLLSKELSKVRDVVGHTKADLSLLLKTKSPELSVKIKTNDFSVSGLYDRIPGKIFLENINFTYEPDRVTVKRLKGEVNTIQIHDLYTELDFKDDIQINICSGSAGMDLSSIIPWLKSYKKTSKMIFPILEGKGKLKVASIDLSGPLLKPDQWKYDLNGSGNGIDLTTQSNQEQINNFSGQFRLTDTSLQLNKIQMNVVNLSFIDSATDTQILNTILLPFDVQNGFFYVGKNKSFFKTDLNFLTGPKVSIDLKGKTFSSLNLKSIKFLDPGYSNGSITMDHAKDRTLIDFNGILNTATLNKLLKPETSLIKKLNEICDNQPLILYTDKDSTLNLSGKSINLNPLVNQFKSISEKDQFFFDKIINFKADILKYKNLNITDIDGKLSLKKNHSYIRIKKAFLCDLETSGYINLKDDIVHASLPFEGNNKSNFQDLLTCLELKDRFMDGRYSLSWNMKATAPKENFLNKISGSIKFNAEEGRIYQLTLISRILSVLNVSKLFKGSIPNVMQEGFAYESISFEADIKDSIIYITKAIINGQDMTLIFSGWVDLLNDKLDLICLVAPFKTVDLIIQHIPIINTLLSGRLISIPIEASGTVSDPDVIPLHPSAVGSSLVNMMSDILNTPVKLWDEMNDE